MRIFPCHFSCLLKTLKPFRTTCQEKHIGRFLSSKCPATEDHSQFGIDLFDITHMQ